MGSKTGNTVGVFANSQKIASLTGADAANYSYANVVGNYQVKTGFSSGSIYPREMSSSAIKPVVYKVSPLAQLAEPTSGPKDIAQDQKPSGAPLVSSSKAAEELKSTPPQASKELAPKALAEPDRKAVQVASSENNAAKSSKVLQPSSPQRSASLTPSSSLASGFAPDNLSTGLAPEKKASLLDEKTSIPESQPSSKSETANTTDEDWVAPIYAVAREVLSSEVTYQVVGGVTSVVVVTNALLTAASKLGFANLAGNLPVRVPVNIPTPSSSMISNRFNPKLFSRI
jgi:hypothetical protein